MFFFLVYKNQVPRNGFYLQFVDRRVTVPLNVFFSVYKNQVPRNGFYLEAGSHDGINSMSFGNFFNTLFFENFFENLI